MLVSQIAYAQPIEVFEDPTGSITIEQILAEPDRFEQTHQKSFGFSQSTFWLRVQLSNPSTAAAEQTILLEAVHAPSEIVAYRLTADGIEILRSGSNVPIAKRPNDDRLINFPFTLAPASQDTVYLKVQDRFQIHLGHRVVPVSLAQKHNERFIIFSVAVISALLALLVYNLSIALLSRSRLYAYYSILLAASLFIFAVDSRQTELVGWLSNRDLAYPATTLFFAASFLFLSELFKEVESRVTRLNRSFALTLSIVHLLLPVDLMIQTMDSYLTLFCLLALAVEIIHALFKRHPLAPCVALGWMLYLATIVISILASQGTIAPGWANLYALGSVVEALTFSTALAFRLRLNEKFNLGLIAQLKQTINVDSMTGLLNHAGIHQWLERETHPPLGVVLIDIDRFKSVNDTFSTEVGNRLLCQIARILKTLTPADGQIARLGSDEFLIALPFISEERFMSSSQQLVSAVHSIQIDYRDQLISRTASAGSVRLDPSSSISQALTKAHLALANAKASGGDCCTHFTSEFQQEVIQNGAYITDVEIEAALRAQEFKYFVQPIYRATLNGTSVEGFEALIRWIKPTGEVILPGAFAKNLTLYFLNPSTNQYANPCGKPSSMRLSLWGPFMCH